jgi:hypothetical protein
MQLMERAPRGAGGCDGDANEKDEDPRADEGAAAVVASHVADMGLADDPSG